MRTERIYHLTHLPVIRIRALMTGIHSIIAFSLNLPIFYSAVTKCLQATLTSFLASGKHLLPPTTTSPHFRTPKNFTTQLILPLLAMSPGSHSAYSIMELSLYATFRHGWKRNTKFGLEIPELLSKICCQTRILNLTSIMCHFKNILLMELIVFETSCPESGPGSRQ
jgi:hypothetical protein